MWLPAEVGRCPRTVEQPRRPCTGSGIRQGTPKGRPFWKKHRTQPDCYNGVKEQLRLESKRTFNKIVSFGRGARERSG
jgi:hypothetical protein